MNDVMLHDVFFMEFFCTSTLHAGVCGQQDCACEGACLCALTVHVCILSYTSYTVVLFCGVGGQ